VTRGALRLEPSATGFTIAAEDLGPLLGLAPAEVPELMRQGIITSRFETGAGEDEGRYRLTFLHGTLRLRLTVDAEGKVLTQSRVHGAKPLFGLP